MKLEINKNEAQRMTMNAQPEVEQLNMLVLSAQGRIRTAATNGQSQAFISLLDEDRKHAYALADIVENGGFSVEVVPNEYCTKLVISWNDKQ